MIGVPYVFQRLKAGKFLTFLHESIQSRKHIGLKIDEIRSFVYVNDVVHILDQAISLHMKVQATETANPYSRIYRAYNVGGPHSLSRMDLGKLLADVMQIPFIVSTNDSTVHHNSQSTDAEIPWIVDEIVSSSAVSTTSTNLSVQSPRNIAMDSSETEVAFQMNFTSLGNVLLQCLQVP
jgi:hypothetical protein